MFDYYFFSAIAILLVLDLGWSVVRAKSSKRVLGDIRAETEELKQECLRLKAELQAQRDLVTSEFQAETFKQLQTILTQYPTIIQMVEFKPDLPAKNLLPLFITLDNLITTWQYQTIGVPWVQVNYNPRLHQADSADIQHGEMVYIRFVGYCSGDRILAPAKVSRTLPFTTLPVIPINS
jgi:molecular chaperone GrpE (heat shock protein)